jgi:hypothetical protein
MTNIACEGFLTRRGEQELEGLANDFQEEKQMPLYLDEIYYSISRRKINSVDAPIVRNLDEPVKLPNHQNAVISERKLAGYLLSSSHAYGRHKAAFFTRFGFSVDAQEILAQALLEHASKNEVVRIEDSPFGRRYIVDGELSAPDKRTPRVRAIWFIETGEDVPHLVTASPLEKA